MKQELTNLQRRLNAITKVVDLLVKQTKTDSYGTWSKHAKKLHDRRLLKLSSEQLTIVLELQNMVLEGKITLEQAISILNRSKYKS